MILQRILAFFMASLSFAASMFGFEVPLGKKTEAFRVTSYVVAENITADSFYKEDLSIITNIILFGCAGFDTDGSITVNEKTLEKALGIINAAKENREIIITINLTGPQRYGDSDIYTEQMAYQAALHTEAFRSGVLEENIKKLIDNYKLDGVHFDYEYPITHDAWKAFNKFLVSLRKEIPDKKLGVAVSDWDIGLNTKAYKAVDYIELMLYDNYDADGRHATAEICKSYARNCALNGIPLDKVNFGLPFYARPTDRGAYWYAYNGYYDKLDENGFYYDKATDKTFWFNTPDVIEDKTDFAINNGFGGVMIWHYTCDLPSGNKSSLLRAVNTAITNNKN